MWPRCIGCAACTPELDPEAAARLHSFATATVAGAARGDRMPAAPPDRSLQVKAGVFVTLRRGGQLRGCIGHIEADTPLARITGAMARAAALDDPRFPPLGPTELDGLDVELSVLDARRPGTAEALVPGRDGVIVSRGRARGVLLPQVADEWGWGAAELLAGACRKAGLAPDAWRRQGAVIELFRVQIITAPVRP